ncbi:MAG: SMC-Scp complex subunit ScpB [Oscillospiraceae bacterium]
MCLLEKEQIIGACEAILFASGEPVSVEKLQEVLVISKTEMELSICALEERYNTPTSGIRLVKLNDSLQFCTNRIYISPVREIMDLKRNTPLSSAALEVLSLVAYNEPVTKAFVEQVRGVDCSGVLGSLTQKDLIEERGRLELPGRPLLYGTTDNFLRCFGITSLAELPPIPQEKTEMEEKPDIAEAQL